MRRGVLFILTVIAINGINYGQSQDKKVRLNVELNQFITGSGFATGTELYFKLLDPDFKRTLAFGIFYDVEYAKITGISLHHEVMLWRKSLQKGPLKPHLFYNFIYRKTTIPEVGPDLKSNGDLATYTSFEHHLGVGMNMQLSKNLYFSVDLGYGVYLGSIKKPTAFNPITEEVRGGNGFGMIAQFGIGYNFF